MNNLEVFDEGKDTTMDAVFQKIQVLYDKNILFVVLNTLKLIEKEENESFRSEYYEGLQTILGPLNKKIQKWIQDQLLCT